jgi:hypothetical protein
VTALAVTGAKKTTEVVTTAHRNQKDGFVVTASAVTGAEKKRLKSLLQTIGIIDL